MQTDDEKRKQEMATFKLVLISPVINNTFTEPSKAAYYRNIGATPITMPDGTSRYFNPRTMADWEYVYRKHGFEGLVPKSRCDAGGYRKLNDDTVAALYALKNRFPKISATLAYETMIKDGVIDKADVSLSTVQRFFRNSFGKGTPCATPVKDRRAFEAERVNGIWQADTLYGPYVSSPKGARGYLQMIVDDKSRRITSAHFWDRDTALNFQRTLKQAVLSAGIPEKLYVDNGGPYKNDQLSLICGQLGIVLIHAPVRDGAAKGKIERLNRTFRSRFMSMLESPDLETMDTLNDRLAAWVADYNRSVHSSIGRTPLDAFTEAADTLRYVRSVEWADECFLNRDRKKVKKDSTIRIQGIDFDCPMGYMDVSVEVRYDPADMGRVWIMDEGTKIECAATDRVANSKAKRQKTYDIDYGGSSHV